MARNLLPDFDKLATSNVWRASTGPSTRLSSTINPGQPLLSSTGIAEQDLDKVGQGASLLSSNGVCNQAAQSHFQNLEEQRVGVEEAYWSSTGIRDPAILEFHKKLVGNVDQEPEDYASLPDYIKVLDKFAVLFQTSTSQTAAFAKKTAEIKFHDNISQEKMGRRNIFECFYLVCGFADVVCVLKYPPYTKWTSSQFCCKTFIRGRL